MSLAVRVIPTLLMRGPQLVKGNGFNPWRVVGHVSQAMFNHQARGVDEVILLDVTRSPYGHPPDFDMIAALTDKCFSPVTVGGGITTVDHIQRVLAMGADKVSIGTGLYTHTNLLKDAAKRFGSQAIVASIDVSGKRCISHCASVLTEILATVMAQACEENGAGEILLTNVDREGFQLGYDLDLIGSVARRVSIPVIAHGGCSGPADMKAAIDAGASAVAAGALFQFTDTTPKQCAEYLHEQGIEVRR